MTDEPSHWKPISEFVMTTEIYHSVSLRINIKGGGLHWWYMTFDQQCSIGVVKQCKLMDGEAPWFRGNTGLHSMRFNVMLLVHLLQYRLHVS